MDHKKAISVECLLEMSLEILTVCWKTIQPSKMPSRTNWAAVENLSFSLMICFKLTFSACAAKKTHEWDSAWLRLRALSGWLLEPWGFYYHRMSRGSRHMLALSFRWVELLFLDSSGIISISLNSRLCRMEACVGWRPEAARWVLAPLPSLAIQERMKQDGAKSS